jgi:mannose-6-phosphate isomerase-like protein (cupin superfamily)
MWRTCWLPERPDAISPGGASEIRHLIQLDDGDLTHALCPAGRAAHGATLPERYEAYFVLAGRGEIWRRLGDREGITVLRPGRWVEIPAGTEFQYRAYRETTVVFLVVVLPSWQPDAYHTIDAGPWPAGGYLAPPTDDAQQLSADWMTGDLAAAPSHVGLHGLDVRLLTREPSGAMAHLALPPERLSFPVRHTGAHQIWFVAGGQGELWRHADSREDEVVLLRDGVALDIPAGTDFQVRSTGLTPLHIVTLTLPRVGSRSELSPSPSQRWAP